MRVLPPPRFSGNPAAVVKTHGSDAWMTKCAAEFNVSETAFLERLARTVYGLRWFTPTTEVGLCGHATLAAAHALFEDDPQVTRLTGPQKGASMGLQLECVAIT